MEKIFFDKQNSRLVYIEKEANQDLWSELWLSDKNLETSIKKRNTFVSSYTKKYLGPGSKILEGGCGNGHHVYALKQNNFDSYGIDYAEEVVKKVKALVPDLDIRKGDVFNLEEEDQSLDGYWSLGVIEHYFNGYEGITNEMKRVLKKDGYLFLTFPWFNPLRKRKAFSNKYPAFEENTDVDQFYQFALDHNNVIDHLSDDFTLVYKRGLSAFEGLLKETQAIGKFLGYIHILSKKSIIFRILSKLLHLLLDTKLFCNQYGHSVLLILKKKNQP